MDTPRLNLLPESQADLVDVSSKVPDFSTIISLCLRCFDFHSQPAPILSVLNSQISRAAISSTSFLSHFTIHFNLESFKMNISLRFSSSCHAAGKENGLPCTLSWEFFSSRLTQFENLVGKISRIGIHASDSHGNMLNINTVRSNGDIVVYIQIDDIFANIPVRRTFLEQTQNLSFQKRLCSQVLLDFHLFFHDHVGLRIRDVFCRRELSLRKTTTMIESVNNILKHSSEKEKRICGTRGSINYEMSYAPVKRECDVSWLLDRQILRVYVNHHRVYGDQQTCSKILQSRSQEDRSQKSFLFISLECGRKGNDSHVDSVLSELQQQFMKDQTQSRELRIPVQRGEPIHVKLDNYEKKQIRFDFAAKIPPHSFNIRPKQQLSTLLDSIRWRPSREVVRKRAAPMETLPGRNVQVQREDFETIKLIGQLDRKFIIAFVQNSGKLLAFDQHACDERIRLERLYCMMETQFDDIVRVEKLQSVQEKSFFTLTVSTSEMDVLKLARLQFTKECSSSDGRFTCRVYETLNIAGRSLTPEELVGFLSEGTCIDKQSFFLKSRLVHKILSSKACRFAIKFGDALSWEQMSNLLTQLRNSSLPFQCAHGRPSVVPLTEIPS